MPERTGAKSQRLERVEHEVVRELSELIHESLKDPRVGFVTIVKCEVSPDLRTARVFASPMGDRRQSAATITGQVRSTTRKNGFALSKNGLVSVFQ